MNWRFSKRFIKRPRVLNSYKHVQDKGLSRKEVATDLMLLINTFLENYI